MTKRRFVHRRAGSSNSENRVRILIAHDHSLFREGLVQLFEPRQDLHVVGQAADGLDAVHRAFSLTPDILLLDFTLRKISGLEVLKRLRSLPLVRAVFLTSAVSQQEIVEALELGACGVLSKDTSVEQLMECVDAVHAGRVWIRQDAVAGLVHKFQIRTTSNVNTSHPAESGITRRQMEVIVAVTEGRCNREIAQKLSIGERTVKHHLTSIFEKFGVSNRLELALYAREKNLLSLPEKTA